MSKGNLVVKTNQLNSALQNLSLPEIRIIQLAIVDARETNTGLSTDKPLRIDALDLLNTTRFVLTMDTDYDTDDKPNTVSNSDIVEVTYTPELIYVSRACGYKTIFNDLFATRATDPSNWIIDVEVINTTINNEDAAQINIYH